MDLTVGGYFRKQAVERPAWIDARSVEEVCSVSHCVSEAPEGWIDSWLYNELGWFNSPKLALAATRSSPRSLSLFAYRILPVRYRSGVEEHWVLPTDVQAVPLEPAFGSLGFDAVSRSMDDVLGFECSPLSCCNMAAACSANRFCLVDSLERAVSLARQFSLDEPEPGPYYVVEVLRQSAA